MYFPVEEMKERIDDVGGGLRIIQRRDLFAFGTDAVLLSKFATLAAGDRVIDLGAGTGLIPFGLVQRKRPASITALELQPTLVQLCRRSVELNGLTDLIQVVQGDLREVRSFFAPESFDLATCNPPYLPVTGSLINARKPVAIARHELCCKLEDVIGAFAWLVRFGGKAALVHRPQRLADILCLFRDKGLEPKRMQLVHPRPGREANIVLVEAEKGAKPGLIVLPPLVIREGDED